MKTKAEDNVFMELDDQYRVLTDPKNFILQRLVEVKNRKNGEISLEWKHVGFFGKFDHLLKIYSNEKVRDLGNTTLDEVRELLIRLHSNIERVVKKENIKLNVH